MQPIDPHRVPDVVECALLIVSLIDPQATALTAGQCAACQVLIDSGDAFRISDRFTHAVRRWRAAGLVTHPKRSWSGPLRTVPAIT